jgi:hypothetical protein
MAPREDLRRDGGDGGDLVIIGEGARRRGE